MDIDPQEFGELKADVQNIKRDAQNMYNRQLEISTDLKQLRELKVADSVRTAQQFADLKAMLQQHKADTHITIANYKGVARGMAIVATLGAPIISFLATILGKKLGWW